MNFGKWIFVAFVLFAGFIATLVTVCMREDISLVSKEYYADELAYQDQITRINNTSALELKPEIIVSGDLLMVSFDSLEFIDKGNLKLFCPSDASMDRSFELNAVKGPSFTYSLSGLKSGMYRVKLLWGMDSKDYYLEEIINH